VEAIGVKFNKGNLGCRLRNQVTSAAIFVKKMSNQALVAHFCK
jgi:hypothetical protein